VPRSWRRPTPDTLIYVNRSSISGHPLGRGRACARPLSQGDVSFLALLGRSDRQA
jgi:hypothetical protein